VRYRPINHAPEDPRLARYIPDDLEHIDRYPLRAADIEALREPQPMTIGVNWYSNFDTPERDKQGHYWIGRGDLGHIRGGHCVCLKPRGIADHANWYRFYNQGKEGACVGFGCSRMMTLLNRVKYDPRWLWDRAKERDQWPSTNPGDDEGTSVRAGCEVLRAYGHVIWNHQMTANTSNWRARANEVPMENEGIVAFRWATSANDILNVVGYQDRGYADVLNSWGRDWPHLVRIPAETLARLLDEDGEFAVVTDR
jgi:hypothetical protein